LRLVLGMDDRHHGVAAGILEALLLEAGGEEDRLSVELRAASLHRDAAPAVGEAGEVLLVAVPLEAAVQLVRDAAGGERVVVAGLRAAAEEVVEADGAA